MAESAQTGRRPSREQDRICLLNGISPQCYGAKWEAAHPDKPLGRVMARREASTDCWAGRSFREAKGW